MTAIVARASSVLETDVAILDLNLQVRAWGGSGDVDSVLPAIALALGGIASPRPAVYADQLDLGEQGGHWLVQPLLIEGEQLGWVLGRADRRGFDVTKLAVAQVAMAAALSHLEQRAASRARAETIDALVCGT